MAQTMRVCETVAARPSSTAWPTVPRMATMKAAIMVLEWPGSSPCSAPSRIALGTNSHACAAPCWISSAKDGIGPSQVLCYVLERFDRTPLLARQRLHDVVEAVIEVVLDQRLLRLADRFFDGLKLLRQLQARPSRFDH